MTDKEIVTRFFIEGYANKNYDFIMNCLSEDYFDHSPAAARSNKEAVDILKIVESWGYWPDKEIEQLLVY